MKTPDEYAASGTEHAQQVALFMWAAQYDDLAVMHAIPNGGLRDPITAARLKAEGTKSGVPDVSLPIPVNQYHGLYIEMKRPKSARGRKGKGNEKQDRWRDMLTANGYCVVRRFSFSEARDAIIAYMQGKWLTYDISAPIQS
jgi:hypothetical protein